MSVDENEAVERAEVTARIYLASWSHEPEPNGADDYEAAVGTLHPAEQDPARVFASNIRAVIATACLPHLMAYSAVYNRRLMALVLDERARQNPQAETTARERLERERSEAGVSHLISRAVVHELHAHLVSEDFSLAAEELLRQCATLTWSAAETIIKDLHRVRFPEQHYQLGESLARMLSSPRTTKEILESFGLWLLFQQRHLIVHRAGMVDREFIARTDCTLAEGTRLTTTPAELESHISATVQLAMRLIAGPIDRGALRPEAG